MNKSDGLNYSVIRKTSAGLVNIFVPIYSGSVLGLTDLLTSMVVQWLFNSVINNDISGPLNIFIKSDIIANAKMHKTVFSNNIKLTNLIAPLELHNEINTFRVPTIVELFLGKKITLSSIDIQIVDEQGNIVNLNNNAAN
jgi:hypothetical protein